MYFVLPDQFELEAKSAKWRQNGGGSGNASFPSNQRVSFPNLETSATENKSELVTSPNLPVGGTTGLCHQTTGAIDEAASWYRSHRDTCEHPVIPALRRRFGLTAHEAVTAIREAQRL